jgi:hypothetical protein
MVNIFTRLEKRKAFPVDIDGETIHVTEPTMGQIARIQKLGTEDSTGLALGLCIVDPSGVPVFEIMEGIEDDLSFSRRVMKEAESLTPSVIKRISDAILALTKPVKVESLVKN